MIDTFVKLEECVNNCLLNKLAKPYHENEHHIEFQIRLNKLEEYFPKLITLLENVDFKQEVEITSSTLYSILILYTELKTNGPWNSKTFKAKQYPEKLNDVFKKKYDIFFEEILMKDVFNAQELFDKSIKELHQKMTLDDFKKYPGLIEVYYLLIKKLKEYRITLNPVTVLPISLLLVDDYVVSNKVKGLQCCVMIFQCLKNDSFTSGNYYEVVYRSLKKCMFEKDMDVTKSLFKCFPEFLKILPSEIQKSKLDDVFSSVLNELQTESRLYRKAECFKFTTTLIEIHGIHCVKKKKMFKDIICDNLDICCNEGVHEIIMQHVLECLLIWTKHCWCVWKLQTDQQILSSLIKTLYLVPDVTTKTKIQDLILTLIYLCTKDEKLQICSNLETESKYLNEEFIKRIQETVT